MADETLPLVWPPAWKAGMKIGILSTSSPTIYDFSQRAERGRKNLEAVLSGQANEISKRLRTSGFVVEKPEIIAEHIHEMFLDKQVGLIVAAVGGFNTNSVLPYIDWDLLRAHPTYVCGYSDTSALLDAINARARIGTLHGPALLPQWGDMHGPFEETINSFYSSIASPDRTNILKYAGFWCDPRTDWNAVDPVQTFHGKQRFNEPWRVLRPGTAQGRLIGGNIETVNMLLGTPYCPSFDQKILFLEATGAEAYLPRFQRALTHLQCAGVFSRIRGLIVGRCPDAKPVAGTSLDEILLELLADSHFPVMVDVDLGHTEPMITLPIGANAVVVAEPGDVSIVLKMR